MPPVNLIEAGHRLRVIRESLKMTQFDIQVKTAELEKAGRGKRVYAQQLQRIEVGHITKPPILDLLSVALALGMSTRQILELYGLWVEGTGSGEVHPTLQQAQRILDQLDPEEQEQFLSWVDFAIVQGRALIARHERVKMPV